MQLLFTTHNLSPLEAKVMMTVLLTRGDDSARLILELSTLRRIKENQTR